MVNPFTTSDANVPFEQDQDAVLLTSHVPETHTTATVVTPQKHLLYVEDYDSMPPAYSVAQQQTEQRSSEAMLGDAYDNDGSIEESELDTAPLIATAAAAAEQDDSYRYPPTAPSIDQIEFGLPHNANSSSRHAAGKKRWTAYRVYLAFAIFASGITLMSAALATIDCYNSCQERDDCDKCPKTRREGFTAFFYITFILSSIAIMGKVVQRLLC